MPQAAPACDVIQGDNLRLTSRPKKLSGQPTGQPLVNHNGWLSMTDLIELSDQSKQAVTKALKARWWRGVDLVVQGLGGGVAWIKIHRPSRDCLHLNKRLFRLKEMPCILDPIKSHASKRGVYEMSIMRRQATGLCQQTFRHG